MTADPAPAASSAHGPPSTVPWAGARALFDVVIIYLVALVIAQVLVVVVLTLRGGGGSQPVLVAVAATPVAILSVAAGWLWIRYGRAATRAAGRARWRAADVGVGFAVGLAGFIGQQTLLSIVVWVLTRLGVAPPAVQDTFRSLAADPATAPVLVITAVLFAPLGEELLFRGVLFQGLRARYGFWAAALGSAGLFTLAHLGDASGALADAIIVAGILPLGVVFAAVMERRGSLLACVVAHATYNLGGVALLVGTA